MLVHLRCGAFAPTPHHRQCRWLSQLINLFIILIFLAALIGFGVWLSYTTRFRAFQGIPGFSYTWVTLSVPVAGALMVITTILKIRDKLTREVSKSIQDRYNGDVF